MRRKEGIKNNTNSPAESGNKPPVDSHSFGDEPLKPGDEEGI